MSKILPPIVLLRVFGMSVLMEYIGKFQRQSKTPFQICAILFLRVQSLNSSGYRISECNRLHLILGLHLEHLEQN